MLINQSKLDLQLAKQETTLSSFQGKISPSTLARIKRGEDNITPKTVGRLARLLNCEVEDLIGEVQP